MNTFSISRNHPLFQPQAASNSGRDCEHPMVMGVSRDVEYGYVIADLAEDFPPALRGETGARNCCSTSLHRRTTILEGAFRYAASA